MNNVPKHILAIDPGTYESAWVFCDSISCIPIETGKYENELMGLTIKRFARRNDTTLAVEQIRSNGNVVGQETFDTCVWIGRFLEMWESTTDSPFELIPRIDVKMAICLNPRAKDPNIRQALIDRFGGTKETKKGGTLYGVKSDIWSALAVAVTYSDKVKLERLRDNVVNSNKDARWLL